MSLFLARRFRLWDQKEYALVLSPSVGFPGQNTMVLGRTAA